ncbi:hypothetical protein BRX36_20290 [Sphingomonas sp. S-NIH.Pt1_0416]|nr:hypothetical protein BRX36_20290 [Sphingomonas sp. S-NIH.Pt1_0416]
MPPTCQIVSVCFSRWLKHVFVSADLIFRTAKHRLNFLMAPMTRKQKDRGHDDVLPDRAEHARRRFGVLHVGDQARDFRFHAP